MKPVKFRSNQYLMYIQSNDWYSKTKKCHKLTKNYCVVFPWLKSRECHHLTYRNLKNEVPLRDIVVLSKTAHKIIHLWIFWKVKPVRFVVNQILRILFVFSCLIALLR